MKCATFFSLFLLSFACVATGDAQDLQLKAESRPDSKAIAAAAAGIAVGSYAGWQAGWYLGKRWENRFEATCNDTCEGLVLGREALAYVGAITVGSIAGPALVKLTTQRKHVRRGMLVAVPLSIVAASLVNRLEDNKPIQYGFAVVMLTAQSSLVAGAMHSK